MKLLIIELPKLPSYASVIHLQSNYFLSALLHVFLPSKQRDYVPQLQMLQQYIAKYEK